MKADQEAALVEAMFEARTESGISDRWEGRAQVRAFEAPPGRLGRDASPYRAR